MTETVDILNEMIDACKNAVIQSLQESGRYATGHTVQELQELTTDLQAFLLAPFWIDALEYGRKPTAPGTPASEPPMIENVKAWCLVRGIPESAAYAITRHIHKYGYKGTPGVLTKPLSDESINSLIGPGVDRIADNVAKEFVALFDVFDNK
ncbi:MAG TPA: hypothetical protein VGN20_20495 [Mucilaginibacter sp.]|jgi:hypothetical protein